MATGCSVSKLKAAQIDLTSWIDKALNKDDAESFIWSLLVGLLNEVLYTLLKPIEDLINGFLSIFGLSEILPPFPVFGSDALSAPQTCTKGKRAERTSQLQDMQANAERIAEADTQESGVDFHLQHASEATSVAESVFAPLINATKVLAASSLNAMAEIEDAWEALKKSKETLDDLGFSQISECKNPFDKINAAIAFASGIYNVLMNVAKQSLQAVATTLTAILNPVADVINSIFAFINTLLDSLLHLLGLQKNTGSDLDANAEADQDIMEQSQHQAKDVLHQIGL